MQDITHDADAAIVTAIISLAHSLDLAVVAEGVESKAQQRFLAEKECDAMQRFLVSKPLPASEMSRQLH